MAPPHGACRELSLYAMANLGFEAACVSKGSLQYYNNNSEWLKTLGMKPTAIIKGLPIIFRFPLSQNCQNNILIAVLLNQPIIIRAHHQDVAEGMQALGELSGFINSLGNVHWGNMRQIARNHYYHRIEDKTLHVKMLTKRIEIYVPKGINKVWVEGPLVEDQRYLPLAYRIMDGNSTWKFQYIEGPILVSERKQLEIVADFSSKPVVDTKSFMDLDPFPLMRRVLTETRDRIKPAVHRIAKKMNTK
jgi:hypothetical protein